MMHMRRWGEKNEIREGHDGWHITMNMRVW